MAEQNTLQNIYEITVATWNWKDGINSKYKRGRVWFREQFNINNITDIRRLVINRMWTNKLNFNSFLGEELTGNISSNLVDILFVPESGWKLDTDFPQHIKHLLNTDQYGWFGPRNDQTSQMHMFWNKQRIRPLKAQVKPHVCLNFHERIMIKAFEVNNCGTFEPLLVVGVHGIGKKFADNGRWRDMCQILKFVANLCILCIEENKDTYVDTCNHANQSPFKNLIILGDLNVELLVNRASRGQYDIPSISSPWPLCEVFKGFPGPPANIASIFIVDEEHSDEPLNFEHYLLQLKLDISYCKKLSPVERLDFVDYVIIRNSMTFTQCAARDYDDLREFQNDEQLQPNELKFGENVQLNMLGMQEQMSVASKCRALQDNPSAVYVREILDHEPVIARVRLSVSL